MHWKYKLSVTEKLWFQLHTKANDIWDHYGEGGIRTHGTSRYTRFQVERDRPLCHLSKYDFNIIAKLRQTITDIIGLILILKQNSTENKMTTHFITAEIDLQENPLQLQQEIEAQLEQQGEPLRWAVTEVDQEQEKVTVEAIVTTED